MSKRGKIPDKKTIEKNRELLRDLAIEELQAITYGTSDEEFDAERIAALMKLIDGSESLPEEIQSDVFLERFNYIHARDDTFDDKKEKEGKTVSKAKKTEKGMYKLAAVITIISLMFGAVNVVSYASAKQNVFQLVEETVSSLVFNYKPTDEQKKQLEEEYILDIKQNELKKIELAEVSDYFADDIYMPVWLPESLTNMEVEASQEYDNEVLIHYFDDDYEHLFHVDIIGCGGTEGDLTIVYDSDNVKSQQIVKIGDRRELLCLAESDGLSLAYINIDDILYLFRYNFDTEQLIKIVENMEVYK